MESKTPIADQSSPHHSIDRSEHMIDPRTEPGTMQARRPLSQEPVEASSLILQASARLRRVCKAWMMQDSTQRPGWLGGERWLSHSVMNIYNTAYNMAVHRLTVDLCGSATNSLAVKPDDSLGHCDVLQIPRLHERTELCPESTIEKNDAVSKAFHERRQCFILDRYAGRRVLDYGREDATGQHDGLVKDGQSSAWHYG